MTSKNNIHTDNEGVIIHDYPIWREKANFILAINLVDPEVPKEWKWEQIWARKIENNIFEVCCIPFFAYGLALGDIVNTHTFDGKPYVISEIIKKKGHYTYRIWFNSTDLWNPVIKEIKKLDCLVEIRWEKSKLIAVDASTIEGKNKLESYLKYLQSTGAATCEMG